MIRSIAFTTLLVACGTENAAQQVEKNLVTTEEEEIDSSTEEKLKDLEKRVTDLESQKPPKDGANGSNGKDGIDARLWVYDGDRPLGQYAGINNDGTMMVHYESRLFGLKWSFIEQLGKYERWHLGSECHFESTTCSGKCLIIDSAEASPAFWYIGPDYLYAIDFDSRAQITPQSYWDGRSCQYIPPEAQRARGYWNTKDATEFPKLKGENIYIAPIDAE